MYYEVYCDGAARGQGSGVKYGHGACAVVIHRNKKTVGQFARGLGFVTNNQAEYEAVLLALLMCWSADIKKPTIYSDSTLVVKQVNGEWNCKNKNLLPLLLSIKEIQQVYSFNLVNVKRNVVSEADALANAFLDNMLEKPVKSKQKNRKKRPSKNV